MTGTRVYSAKLNGKLFVRSDDDDGCFKVGAFVMLVEKVTMPLPRASKSQHSSTRLKPGVNTGHRRRLDSSARGELELDTVAERDMESRIKDD
jgi:hypothetical protein